VNPDVQLGAWIVAAHKALSRWGADQIALDPFEAIIIAGRAGDLFSATRAMGMLDAEKFESHRKLARIRPLVARQVLREAETLDLVEITWASGSDFLLHHFRFKNNSKEGVLEAVGKLFPRLEPSNVARATLEILGATVDLPRTVDDISNLLSSKGFVERDITLTTRLINDLGLVSKTDEKESGISLLFNPYAFEKNAEDVYKALKSLSSVDHDEALRIVEQVRNNPGVPLPAKINRQILSLLVKLGVVDYSKILTQTGTKQAYFPTAPYVWGVFDKSAGNALSQDLVDDSKLLLNSFRYGEYYSQPERGRIKNPVWIINALLRDGAIGVQKPATAIGEDYPLALSRGIVNIVESLRYPGRYSMELLKTDVASAVLEVLQQKAMLPKETIPTDEEVERAGQFMSPGAVRIEEEIPDSLKKYHEEMIFALRTSRRKR